MILPRKIAMTIGIFIACIIFYLSVLTPYIPTVEVKQIDKLYHLLAYAFLMWWWAQLYAGKQQLIVLVVVIFFGIFIELVQPLNQRFFEVEDILANSLGTIVGALLAKFGPKIVAN